MKRYSVPAAVNLNAPDLYRKSRIQIRKYIGELDFDASSFLFISAVRLWRIPVPLGCHNREICLCVDKRLMNCVTWRHLDRRLILFNRIVRKHISVCRKRVRVRSHHPECGKPILFNVHIHRVCCAEILTFEREQGRSRAQAFWRFAIDGPLRQWKESFRDAILRVIL